MVLCEDEKQKTFNEALYLRVKAALVTTAPAALLSLPICTDIRPLLIARALESICYPSYVVRPLTRAFVCSTMMLRGIQFGWDGM